MTFILKMAKHKLHMYMFSFSPNHRVGTLPNFHSQHSKFLFINLDRIYIYIYTHTNYIQTIHYLQIKLKPSNKASINSFCQFAANLHIITTVHCIVILCVHKNIDKTSVSDKFSCEGVKEHICIIDPAVLLSKHLL